MLSRLRAGAIGGAIAAAICFGCAPAAWAGKYTVAQCGSANPTAGDAALDRNDSSYSASADCSSGGDGLELTHGLLEPTSHGQFGAWVWQAPAGTVFTHIEASSELHSQDGDQAALWATDGSGTATLFGATSGGHEIGGDFAEFRSMLRCTAASCNPTTGSSAAVRDVLLTVDDHAAPAVSLDGSLVAAPVVRGNRSLSVAVTDQGGGVSELDTTVNGKPVDHKTFDCPALDQAVATALRPCPGEADREISLDASSAPFATGSNEVEACSSDLALDGVANRTCANEHVFMDDLCPDSEVGGGSELTASFRHGKDRVRLSSKRAPRLHGKLTTGSGVAVGGATICALTRVQLAGEPYVVAATAGTEADGKYRMLLPARASRDVFVHRMFNNEGLEYGGLSIDSKVRPSLEIKPKTKRGPVESGNRLRFRGKLPGPGCSGRVVKVQAGVGKRRWQVFRSVRTNDHCTYRTRYKLRATSRPTKYVFRVRVPEQASYPYEAGASPVRIRRAGPK